MSGPLERSEPHRPGFVGGTLDRVDAVRSDPGKLAAAFAHSAARVLRLDGLDPVVDDDGCLAVYPLPGNASTLDHALLGIDATGPLFLHLGGDMPHGAAISPKMWGMASRLARDQLALYGTARSIVDWHHRHGFCPNCGSNTAPEKGGWARRCGSCLAEHFPRVDPVVIMLAEHDGRILVGRQPRFPAGRYSALAGFVEPGETIEEAVARELFEEAGIRVTDVRYVMSQPWPFPSSLMMACVATALDDRLTIDRTELDDAKWVDAAGVRAAMDGDPAAPFLAPPPFAVAHSLFLDWLATRP